MHHLNLNSHYLIQLLLSDSLDFVIDIAPEIMKNNRQESTPNALKIFFYIKQTIWSKSIPHVLAAIRRWLFLISSSEEVARARGLELGHTSKSWDKKTRVEVKLVR